MEMIIGKDNVCNYLRRDWATIVWLVKKKRLPVSLGNPLIGFLKEEVDAWMEVNKNFLERETREKTCIVYFIQAGDKNGLIKIGFAMDIKKRMAGLQNGSSVKLNLLFAMEGNMNDEKEMHKKFAKFRQHGEWFEPAREILEFIYQKKCI